MTMIDLHLDRKPWPTVRCNKDLTDASSVVVLVDQVPYRRTMRIVGPRVGDIELPDLHDAGSYVLEYEIHWKDGSAELLTPPLIVVVHASTSMDRARVPEISPLLVCQACGEREVPRRGMSYCDECRKSMV